MMIDFPKELYEKIKELVEGVEFDLTEGEEDDGRD